MNQKHMGWISLQTQWGLWMQLREGLVGEWGWAWERGKWLNQTVFFLFWLIFATTAPKLPVSTISPNPSPRVWGLELCCVCPAEDPGPIPLAEDSGGAGCSQPPSSCCPGCLAEAVGRLVSGDSASMLILDFWGGVAQDGGQSPGWRALLRVAHLDLQGVDSCLRMQCLIKEATFQTRLCLHVLKLCVLFYFTINIILFWYKS